MTKEKQFEQLVEDHKRTIYTVCYMFSTSKYQIEDYFQEIMVRLWLGFDSFREESSYRTWVYRVSLNTCLNLNREKKKCVDTVPLSVDIDPYDDSKDMQQVHQLYNLINRLDVIDRAFILLWLDGVSYDEIATIMGTNSNNVGVRLMRIKGKLLQMSNTENR